MKYENKVNYDTTIALFKCITLYDNKASKLVIDIMSNKIIVPSTPQQYFDFSVIRYAQTYTKYYIFLIRMAYDILCHDLPHIYCNQLIKEVKYPIIFNYGYIKRISGIQGLIDRFTYLRRHHFINQLISVSRRRRYANSESLIDVAIYKSKSVPRSNLKMRFLDEINYGYKSLDNLIPTYNINDEEEARKCN